MSPEASRALLAGTLVSETPPQKCSPSDEAALSSSLHNLQVHASSTLPQIHTQTTQTCTQSWRPLIHMQAQAYHEKHLFRVDSSLKENDGFFIIYTKAGVNTHTLTQTSHTHSKHLPLALNSRIKTVIRLSTLHLGV